MCTPKDLFSGESVYKYLCSILLIIVGFFGTQLYIKNVEIQKDLVEIKVAITKLQSETLTKDDVREICHYEISKYFLEKK